MSRIPCQLPRIRGDSVEVVLANVAENVELTADLNCRGYVATHSVHLGCAEPLIAVIGTRAAATPQVTDAASRPT
jgi:hypothetical protein